MIGIDVPLSVLLSLTVASLACYAALELAGSVRGAGTRRAGWATWVRLPSRRLAIALLLGGTVTGAWHLGWPMLRALPGRIGLDARWLVTAAAVACPLALAGMLLLGRRARRLTRALQQARLQLQYLGTHDMLTGLPNRQQLAEQIAIRLASRIGQAIEARTGAGHAATLFVLGLDNFRAINDSLGHAVGDDVLKACAQRLREMAHEGDVVARLGGDQFGVLMHSRPGRLEAAAIATALRQVLGRYALVHDVRVRVSASVGIALCPSDGRDAESLLLAADAAMQYAKRAGRNTHRFFEVGMHADAARTLTLQRDLQRALDEGHLSLVFQPKYRIAGRALAGAEALIRWNHPELGNVPPPEFIPIAERSGQIIQVGEWVIREVCRWIRDWDSEALPPVQISINLSAAQFEVPDLAGRVDTIVRAAGVRPQRLMFEITESVAMQNAERAAETIRAFHAHGFELAIDDFGTGYSSLAYLQRFKVRQIKVDRYFTQELDEHETEGKALLSAIVTLSHALQMEVVAEGVETGSQLDTLTSVGCDEVQGFLLSRPLSVAAFRQHLRERHGAAHAAGATDVTDVGRMQGRAAAAAPAPQPS
ncbi:hypothetical protein BKK81_08240 [Cupriavidus sp. USMAHM13]|uniref:Bifunctional diguanylate cyclase/phosphodiesterase n=1 Tax=Cupriavidus malaysiensis TaxID=367825 RepID=A0ABN4TFU2_9BURK|nr:MULTISPECIES: bifunctional diguanylate cyclase/phosphodiesterase [Cupriavidus]AOY99250.1 hypothetical protein BKK81_08240 [Cupriavidus sp. USMAHM13]AOZ05673.1 hypothetical protein BKK80_07545 [Cupriavidus malaysiensis]